MHSLLDSLPIDAFLLRVIHIFVFLSLAGVYLRGDHVVGAGVVLFYLLLRAIAVDLSLLLIQVFKPLLGTHVVGRLRLRAGVDDETATGFIRFVAFPFKGRRIVIPVHWNIIIRGFHL